VLEPTYVPDSSYTPEVNYRDLSRKQTIQHGVTLLAYWLHGYSEKKIAELVGIGEEDVRRDLQWMLGLMDRRRARSSGEALPAKTPVQDQMPATVCFQCAGTLPRGADRVIVLAALRSKIDDLDTLETTRTLTFCRDCAMKMPTFAVVNDLKLRVEKRAECLVAASSPGEDAFDNARARTGHGGSDDADVSDDEVFGAADAEAIEFSDRNPQALPESRSPKEITRERLALFLNDQRSRKLRPSTRRVAELYVGYLTQDEIARRTGMDQSSVSRAIQAALRIASAP